MNRFEKSVSYVVLAAMIASAGCKNAGQGAVSGAGIGALTGLAIGSISGNAGKGAAIGAVVGGVGGAVVGNENKKKAEKAERDAAMDRQQSGQSPPQGTVTTVTTPAPTPAPAPTATVVTVTTTNTYQTGPALGRFVGTWNISGIVEGADGKPVPVTATAKGTIDKTYFLRLDINIKDPRDGSTVQGTSVISQRGGRALEMTNTFSSSPVVKQFRGEMDESGNVFSFTQFDPPGSSRKVILRATDAKGFTADVWDGSKKLESYTFTAAN